MGSKLAEEIDCASFFDQIDDLIDFPPDDGNVAIGGELLNSGDCNDFSGGVWSGALPDSSDCIFSNISAAENSVAYEEVAQLEWLSTFADISFPNVGLNPIENQDIACPSPNEKDTSFRTSSPVSVLESSNNSISKGNMPRCGPQRARSKRSRPPVFNPRPAMIRRVETPENLSELSSSSDFENFPRLLEPKQKKQKKNKDDISSRRPPQAASVRKCVHCEVTKTPQWRAGPKGPKTLCNACGVRFKSGRLFPEYRPAASPTFLPTVHSNSHKKVLEMRQKAGPGPAEVSSPS